MTILRPCYRIYHPPKLHRGHFASEVVSLYNFPANADGAGQTIGIIALGGGYRISDIQKYCVASGISAPAIHDICINGTRNNPTVPNSHDRELALDLQVVISAAPAARIVVYFAPNNDKGFYDAIAKAVTDKINRPGVVSISWGAPEKTWSARSMQLYNELFRKAAANGITICAASGNIGSCGGIRDGNMHVDFPASSPWVLACGGTHLMAENGRIRSELVWHESDYAASGGGVSEHFPLPDYQQTVGVPLSGKRSFRGRGVPDVAGNASHARGYRILVNGVWMVLGGTSAVAPLYAGLIARLNQLNGANLGFVNPFLYANPQLFRSITQGNNVTAHPHLGYLAQNGWDACTGLGVFDGTKMADLHEIAMQGQDG